MNTHPPFGTEVPIDWHDLPQNQGQPAPNGQNSGQRAGWSPALCMADSQHSHGQSVDAQTTAFLSQSQFYMNFNTPALDTGDPTAEYNPFCDLYHNAFKNPPTSSFWTPSLDPSATWQPDLNAASLHTTSSQHDAPFEVGTMFQLSESPHHVLYHATEAAAPSSVSLATPQAHPVAIFNQFRVQGEPEANPESDTIYGNLQRTGNTPTLPSPPRAIRPKPMPRCDVATTMNTKQQEAQVTRLATAHSLPRLIRPGKRWMEGDGERATSLKRKRSLSPHTKRARIPEEHFHNCFEDTVRPEPYPEAEMSGRQRSAKVCFRCQDQKLKCDGGFPCHRCQEVAKRGKIKFELPCIEADLNALNPFFDLCESIASHRDNRTNPILRFVSFSIAREASELSNLMYPIPPTAARGIISDFSYFTSTGLPATIESIRPYYGSRRRETSRDGEIRPRTVQSAPEPGFAKNHQELEAVFTLITILFRGEAILGPSGFLTRQETHALRFHWVARALGLSADLLKKWKACPRDVQPDQKVRLGLMLIALLIVTEYRETYVLESLRREIDEHYFGGSEMTGGHITSIVGYLCRGMTTMKHLRQCLGHFLRRLFGGGGVPREFWEAAVFIGYSSGSQPALPMLRTTISRDLYCWRMRQSLSKKLDAYLRNSIPTPVPPKFGVTRDEFERRVDYLGCKDIRVDLLDVQERGIADELVASKGLLPRQLSEDELRGYAEGITKKRDSAFRRAAADEFQISGDKTTDTVLKYLFLKWLEGQDGGSMARCDRL